MDRPHADYGTREIRVAWRVQARTGLPYTRCERAAHLLYHPAGGRGRVVSDDELAAKPWDKEPQPPVQSEV